MISGAILGLLICIVTLNHFFKPKRKNLAPGPRGIPLIGNVFQFGTFPHIITLEKWAKQYGDIFQCKFFNKSMVIINDPALVKEVFQNQTFTGIMHKGAPFDHFNDGEALGILTTEGKNWETIRRFIVKQLRNFGFGKNSMEHSILEEVKETIRLMKSQEGNPIADIKERLSIGVFNSLWTLIAGKRYSHDDPRIINMTKQTTKVISDVAQAGNVLVLFPWIKNIFPKWSGYITVRKNLDDLVKFLTETLAEHKEIYSEDYQKDFVDMYLNEIKKTTDTKNKIFYGKLGERQLIATAADLFTGGSDTTSTTLAWIFLYMATFPKVQEKIQREIEETTKNSRHCSLTDRPNMPYTEAVIAETLRYSSMMPLVPHKALADAKVRGYFIPKGTIILANFFYIHHNPEIWGDPENFRAERFLSEDGKVFKKHEALMPFSTGRRQCIGEALAKDTLFLFTTNIFQNFTVEFDPTEPNPTLEPAVGFLLNTKPFKVVMKDRT